jgi:hypothetical protein
MRAVMRTVMRTVMRAAMPAAIRRRRTARWLTAATLVVATRAHAQRTPSAERESFDRWHFAHCVTGVTYGAPLKFALAYGGGLLRQSDGKDVCALGVAKVGLGGALAGLGMGTSLGALGGGAMLTANVLRTFAAPWHATPRRTYIGASLHLWPALAFGGEIGVYTRLGDAAGAASGGKHVVSWSAGFGF